jgi:16S rRNA (cytosine967-C5)-methyltransferase
MGDYLALLPHKHHTDGFFAAVFERKVIAKVPRADLDAAAPAASEEPAD